MDYLLPNLSDLAKSQRSASLRINRIEVTDDKLTSRAGLSPFVRYLDGINVFPTFEKLFCSIRKNKKSQKISSIFKQIICFLADGTSSHISYFDYLKNDEGYAAGIEATTTEMLSSHSVKRFFRKFSPIHYFMFRWLLQKLFIWRLNLEKPSVIILGVDTMVMDNDDAVLRQGVQPTYKKKKGFQPLQLNWMGYFVDAVFRGGSKHSNYGDSVQKMIIHVVKQIRRHYRADVPIILRCDSGFFDQKLFELYEKDLDPGIYWYKSETHELVQLVIEDRWEELSNAGFNQLHFETAAAAIVYSAIFERCTQRYGDRGRDRYVCMDLGHSAENVYLQAYALKIGTCAIGSFSDLVLMQVIQMTRAEVPLYIMPLGKV